MSNPQGTRYATPSTRRSGVLYGRIPRRIWEDRGFAQLSPAAKLLFCFLATSPLANPRLAGCMKASPAIIAENLDPTCTAEKIVSAAEELSESGFIKLDWEGRVLWAPCLYFSVNNSDWFLGRFREIGNFPVGPVKDAILLHMLEVDGHFREDNPAYENMELAGLLSERIIAAMSGRPFDEPLETEVVDREEAIDDYLPY